MYHFMPGWRRVHFEFLSFSRKVFVVIWEKEREREKSDNQYELQNIENGHVVKGP